MGDGTLFRGLGTGVTGAAELTKGFGELAEEIGKVANGVGTPPGTGATGAGRMAGVLASLQECNAVASHQLKFQPKVITNLQCNIS